MRAMRVPAALVNEFEVWSAIWRAIPCTSVTALDAMLGLLKTRFKSGAGAVKFENARRQRRGRDRWLNEYKRGSDYQYDLHTPVACSVFPHGNSRQY
jgi:hypothetical protein